MKSSLEIVAKLIGAVAAFIVALVAAAEFPRYVATVGSDARLGAAAALCVVKLAPDELNKLNEIINISEQHAPKTPSVPFTPERGIEYLAAYGSPAAQAVKSVALEEGFSCEFSNAATKSQPGIFRTAFENLF